MPSFRRRRKKQADPTTTVVNNYAKYETPPSSGPFYFSADDEAKDVASQSVYTGYERTAKDDPRVYLWTGVDKAVRDILNGDNNLEDVIEGIYDYYSAISTSETFVRDTVDKFEVQIRGRLEIQTHPKVELPPKDDAVHHPSHYTRGSIEVWDFIVDQGLGYLTGNAIKYICRAGEKDPEKHVQDLQKAIAFLNREIGRVQNGK